MKVIPSDQFTTLPDVRISRRTKSQMQPDDVDVGLALVELIPRMRSLLEEKEALVTSEDYPAAHAKQAEIKELGAQLAALPVCPGCFIERPSAVARKRGREHWAVMCSHCGASSKTDFSDKHFDDLRQSLRRRVRAEIEMAQSKLPASCTNKMIAALTNSVRALKIEFGQGKGPRQHEKEIKSEWLVGQVYRTLERLAPEPSLRSERRALLLALRCMEAR